MGGPESHRKNGGSGKRSQNIQRAQLPCLLIPGEQEVAEEPALQGRRLALTTAYPLSEPKVSSLPRPHLAPSPRWR